MCGRYTLRTPLNVLAEQFLFDLGDLPADFTLPARGNIAPAQMIAAVRQAAEESPRLLAWLRWGLIPSWSKDPKIAARMPVILPADTHDLWLDPAITDTKQLTHLLQRFPRTN